MRDVQKNLKVSFQVAKRNELHNFTMVSEPGITERSLSWLTNAGHSRRTINEKSSHVKMQQTEHSKNCNRQPKKVAIL